MATLSYIIAYLCILAFLLITASKCVKYLKRPVHMRWELYPVAHGQARCTAYGGSYMEYSGWWRKKQKPFRYGTIKEFAVEFCMLHSTFRNNRALWYRTYPFHFGLYMLALTVCLAMFVAILSLLGLCDNETTRPFTRLGQSLALVAFLCIGMGAAALMQRRLTVPDCKNFSTPEHFLNLGLFLGLSALGLTLRLVMPSFFGSLCHFAESLISFSFAPQDSFPFNLFIIFLFALIAYIPATHMGHFFMKFFLWHDIRWNDQPTQDSPEIQKKIIKALGYPVSWNGTHIQGNNEKTWAEITTSRPAGRKG